MHSLLPFAIPLMALQYTYSFHPTPSHAVIGCSEMMLYLPARHNLRVLENIQESGARFFMASTFIEADENSMSEMFVPAVGHRINISLPPYCLPQPMALFKDESAVKSGRHVGLWELHPKRPLALSGDCSPFFLLRDD